MSPNIWLESERKYLSYPSLPSIRTASIPSRYDSSPKPEIVPWLTGAIKDVWRKSSRSSIFERWTSMTGILSA